MTQTIYGKTEGLKKQVLTQLEGIYELRADEGQLISQELALVLRDLSDAINREISLYIDRKGRVTAVAVGSDCHVELPGTDSRRSQNRLCGVACIHTHPSGAPGSAGWIFPPSGTCGSMPWPPWPGKHPRANLFSASG